jgi:hypothetical protein
MARGCDLLGLEVQAVDACSGERVAAVHRAVVLVLDAHELGEEGGVGGGRHGGEYDEKGSVVESHPHPLNAGCGRG